MPTRVSGAGAPPFGRDVLHMRLPCNNNALVGDDRAHAAYDGLARLQADRFFFELEKRRVLLLKSRASFLVPRICAAKLRVDPTKFPELDPQRLSLEDICARVEMILPLRSGEEYTEQHLVMLYLLQRLHRLCTVFPNCGIPDIVDADDLAALS